MLSPHFFHINFKRWKLSPALEQQTQLQQSQGPLKAPSITHNMFLTVWRPLGGGGSHSTRWHSSSVAGNTNTGRKEGKTALHRLQSQTAPEDTSLGTQKGLKYTESNAPVQRKQTLHSAEVRYRILHTKSTVTSETEPGQTPAKHR